MKIISYLIFNLCFFISVCTYSQKRDSLQKYLNLELDSIKIDLKTKLRSKEYNRVENIKIQLVEGNRIGIFNNNLEIGYEFMTTVNSFISKELLGEIMNTDKGDSANRYKFRLYGELIDILNVLLKGEKRVSVFVEIPNNQLNAYYTFNELFKTSMTSGLIQFVILHELSHNILNHNKKRNKIQKIANITDKNIELKKMEFSADSLAYKLINAKSILLKMRQNYIDFIKKRPQYSLPMPTSMKEDNTLPALATFFIFNYLMTYSDLYGNNFYNSVPLGLERFKKLNYRILLDSTINQGYTDMTGHFEFKNLSFNNLFFEKDNVGYYTTTAYKHLFGNNVNPSIDSCIYYLLKIEELPNLKSPKEQFSKLDKKYEARANKIINTNNILEMFDKEIANYVLYNYYLRKSEPNLAKKYLLKAKSEGKLFSEEFYIRKEKQIE